ncbi:NAD(P)-dependent oxidoreductase [Actinomadura yumaensis]|uniref:NAD(P)-dependent oxidoreductase n=1 Tax=Actinomadura yumaensis TaxID=111807 RepID=A0ABW2CFY0_9ACTN
MRLAVFGATGRTGRCVLQQALDGGHQVTAFVRDPSKLSIDHPALTVSTQPLDDPTALAAALADHDAAASALGPNTSRQARAAITTTLTRHIIKALTESGTRRFVAVSAAPVGPVPPDEPFLGRKLFIPLIKAAFAPVYADLATMEAEIRASALAWTIVRPPRLTNGRGRNSYRQALEANLPKGHQISRSDLAHAVLAFIQDPATTEQTIGIAY